MSNERDTSRTPTPDHAEHNAFFPSPYSLSQYTSAKTDFDGADYPTPYKGGKKVLMIGTDERYILMQNGSMFSTGNHPVEMLPADVPLGQGRLRVRCRHALRQPGEAGDVGDAR